MSAAATRRLQKELADIQISGQDVFRTIELIEGDILRWQGKLATNQSPYNKGMFLINIIFPSSYPFDPPKITFLTKIYHPNISEEGEVNLPIIAPTNWQPATRTEQVIQALAAFVNDPESEFSLRQDLTTLYTNDRRAFYKKAEEHTLMHALPRDD